MLAGAFYCHKKYGFDIADRVNFREDTGRQRMVDASHRRLNLGPIDVTSTLLNRSRPKVARWTPAASVPSTEGPAAVLTPAASLPSSSSKPHNHSKSVNSKK